MIETLPEEGHVSLAKTDISPHLLSARWFSGDNRSGRMEIPFLSALLWHSVFIFSAVGVLSTSGDTGPCVFGKRRHIMLTYRQ